MIVKNGNIFHLQGKNTSYMFSVNESGDLVHLYYGKKLRDKKYDWYIRGNSALSSCDASGKSLDAIPQEYPAYGYTDLKMPAYEVLNKNGNTVSRLTFKSYDIVDDIHPVDGMPYLLKGDMRPQTLYITLEDKNAGIEAILSYTVFDNYDIIARNVRIKNISGTKMTVQRAYSLALEVPKSGYKAVYLNGGWGNERNIKETEITEGIKLDISVARGASSHDINPFVMVADKDADEGSGAVYSAVLIYSGNHSTTVESDRYGNIRLLQGINPFGFAWELEDGEVFETPQSILTYSEQGYGGISRELHDVFRNNLSRSKWAKKERPILINNWEATYFDFDEEKLLSIARCAKEQGMDLFVLDDGWFGVRDNDRCSLGDWFVNRDKIPSGIDGLAKKVNDLGLRFGLWFEPEAINPDSKLYRAHPDWIIRVPGMEPSLGRYEYLLDLAKDEVCDYIINAVSDILRTANVGYVKWDMNRVMTDMPYPGYNHKFYLGFYRVMSTICTSFPDVLFEGCASGGGRFDAGVLAYMPQIWTSDNSDAVKRLQIQYGTSLAYPISSISAHVTAVPNHQNGRVTSLKTRGDIAQCGVFGYELDITKMTEDELKELREQITDCKKLRPLMLNGDFYRLKNPFEGNICAWEMAAKDKSEAYLMCAKVLSEAHEREKAIKLCGLSADADYLDTYTNTVYGGDELMYKGIVPKFGMYDFATYTVHLVKIEN